ncbi:MAG: aminotransferase class I/II-fold pyridoxal phosphate-dependent enzyme [Kiritimatiellae bacterium]|nr:aminotransferase class I/II-fold pyridoxal phosphate-dependent enzyme [Kiritimatiellia bacterium]
MKESTLLIHGGIDGDAATGAVNVPIYQTSTYRQRALGETYGWEYSRTGNPTRAALEKLIADLEGGTHGFAFGSGMAAITAVLSLFGTGDKVLISKNVYGGTFRVLDKVFKSFGLGYALADTDDASALDAAITPEVKAILVESPANPLLTVTDLAAAASVAKRRGILTIVDNTFMTPYLQKPLALGADIVVHSATKYLGGHSDVVAGLAVTNRAEIAERLAFIQNATGGVLGPFDSFLLVRGIKTLGVRMDRHVANAEALVARLAAHPEVSRVWYPGLKDFPGHDIQFRQAKNGGAMISFELADGKDHREFFRALRLVTLAESLGGVESLVCHPASMTHASIPRETREKVGITDRLIRLSVGIEDVDDISTVSSLVMAI